MRVGRLDVRIQTEGAFERRGPGDFFAGLPALIGVEVGPRVGRGLGGPSVAILDFRFDKSFDFGRAGRLTPMLDFFNLLNSGVPTTVRTTNTAPAPFKEVTAILNPRVISPIHRMFSDPRLTYARMCSRGRR